MKIKYHGMLYHGLGVQCTKKPGDPSCEVFENLSFRPYVTTCNINLQQILQWLPSVDPQDINMVMASKDDCTGGLVNILSYDLMTRCHKQLADSEIRIIIVVIIPSPPPHWPPT